MNIESFIQTSLQVQLLGKKLRANKCLIVQVIFEDISEGYFDRGSNYVIYVTTENKETYMFNLDEDIHLVED
jgi:hypothetical protein